MTAKSQRLLRESYASLSAANPDFNDATTKARIALETGRAAILLAQSQQPATSRAERYLGPALAFLRNEAIVTLTEEQALASVYSLISQVLMFREA